MSDIDKRASLQYCCDSYRCKKIYCLATFFYFSLFPLFRLSTKSIIVTVTLPIFPWGKIQNRKCGFFGWLDVAKLFIFFVNKLDCWLLNSQHRISYQSRYWKERLCTIDLPVLTSLDQLLLIMQPLLSFFTKQASLMRRSTVQSLSL